MQYRYTTAFVALFVPCCCALLSAGVLPKVTLNKSEYSLGEPVIAKLCLRNDSNSDFSFPDSQPMVAGRSYVIAVKRGLQDWMNWRLDMPYNIDWGPWWQRELIPGTIMRNHAMCVIHLLSVAQSEDDFQLKVVFYKKSASSVRLKTAPEDILFESEPVSFKVKPLMESDPVNRLFDASERAKLAKWITRAHYLGASYNDPDPLRAQIKAAIPQIPESVFHETMLYSTILALSSANEIERGNNAVQAAGLAQEFLKRYPGSWLRPFIYARLFDCHVQQRKYRDALQVAESALKLQDIHPLYENIGFSNRVERVRQRMAK